MTLGQGLVPSLDRNSANPYGPAALASSTDTSGPSDKRPVLAQHAGQGALVSTANVLPRHGVLAWNPLRSVGKGPVGEPSLSAGAECLSPHSTILTEGVKRGKPGPRYSSPAALGRGLLPRTVLRTCDLASATPRYPIA